MTFGFHLPIFLSVLLFSIILVKPAEDAAILYEYSKTLAETGIISYGKFGAPIEGATDFLWMLLIAIGSYSGLEEYYTASALNALSAIYLFQKISKFSNSIFLGIISLLLTPYLWSSTQGFSAITFSAVFVFCIEAYWERKETKLYLGILILCLFRPDGFLWGAPLIVLNQLNRVQNYKKLILLLILPGISYFLLRYQYFGELFPLPFYVKVSGERDFLIFFFTSVKMVGYSFGPFLAYCLYKRDWQSLFVLMVPAIFFSSLTLSQNIGNRYLAPMFFGGLILVKPTMRDTYMIVLMSAVISLKLTVVTVLESLDTKFDNVFYVAKDLASIKNHTMLTTEAGRLPYFSGWRTDDSWGLNTAKFSRDLIQPEDVKSGKYDLVVAHCDLIQLIKVENPKTAKTWENQCNNIVLGARGDYEIYLLPYKFDIHPMKEFTRSFYRDLKGYLGTNPVNQNCSRHDIFFVKNSAIKREEIIKILLKRGAMHHSNNIETISDRVCR